GRPRRFHASAACALERLALRDDRDPQRRDRRCTRATALGRMPGGPLQVAEPEEGTVAGEGFVSDIQTLPAPPGGKIPAAVKAYVRIIDRISGVTGLFAMYLVFAMILILGYATVMKVFFLPSNWTVE